MLLTLPNLQEQLNVSQPIRLAIENLPYTDKLKPIKITINQENNLSGHMQLLLDGLSHIGCSFELDTVHLSDLVGNDLIGLGFRNVLLTENTSQLSNELLEETIYNELYAQLLIG